MNVPLAQALATRTIANQVNPRKHFDSWCEAHYKPSSLRPSCSSGRPFIANPDLPYRLQNDLPMNSGDPSKSFGGDAVGYTDYPFA
jgi:hypothetical protein